MIYRASTLFLLEEAVKIPPLSNHYNTTVSVLEKQKKKELKKVSILDYVLVPNPFNTIK